VSVIDENAPNSTSFGGLPVLEKVVSALKLMKMDIGKINLTGGMGINTTVQSLLMNSMDGCQSIHSSDSQTDTLSESQSKEDINSLSVSVSTSLVTTPTKNGGNVWIPSEKRLCDEESQLSVITPKKVKLISQILLEPTSPQSKADYQERMSQTNSDWNID